MSGGGGGIIIRDIVVEGLTNPTVHGQLPPNILSGLDDILDKDSGTWTAADCKAVGHAVNWALCNLK